MLPNLMIHYIILIAGIVFAISDIVSRNVYALAAAAIFLVVSVLIQLMTKDENGEPKLPKAGLLTYLLFGAIGGFFISPFFHGFVILNVFIDGLVPLAGLPLVIVKMTKEIRKQS